jgi:hypothetical protein
MYVSVPYFRVNNTNRYIDFHFYSKCEINRELPIARTYSCGTRPSGRKLHDIAIIAGL